MSDSLLGNHPGFSLLQQKKEKQNKFYDNLHLFRNGVPRKYNREEVQEEVNKYIHLQKQQFREERLKFQQAKAKVDLSFIICDCSFLRCTNKGVGIDRR